jgi:hypothetical protein
LSDVDSIRRGELVCEKQMSLTACLGKSFIVFSRDSHQTLSFAPRISAAAAPPRPARHLLTGWPEKVLLDAPLRFAGIKPGSQIHLPPTLGESPASQQRYNATGS